MLRGRRPDPRRHAMLKRILLVLAVVFVLIQLWPVDRENPPVASPLKAPPEVERILRDACYDCHSNETKWPWYSYIAPLSWQIAHHVEDGRRELNFSDWGGFRESKRDSMAEEMIEQIEEGEMPPFDYKLGHPEARLTDEQIAVLRRWADGL